MPDKNRGTDNPAAAGPPGALEPLGPLYPMGETRFSYLHRQLTALSEGALSTVLLASDGAVVTPAISWAADPNTGIYRLSADSLGFAAGGVTPLSMNATQLNLSRPVVIPNAATTELLFSGDLQTDIKSDASIIFDFDRDADGAGVHTFEIRAGGVTRLRVHDTPLVIQQGEDSDTPASYQYKSADALTNAVGSELLIKAGESAGTDKAGAGLRLAGGQSTGSGASGPTIFETTTPGASGATVRSLVERARIDNAGLTIADAHAIVAGSSSGLKIATAASQKVGFWNAPPVVQQVLPTGSTTDQVITFLQTLGLCRQA